VLVLAGAFVATTLAASADASVFQIRSVWWQTINGTEVKRGGTVTRWPTRSDGYTVIPVCIAAGSSATQKNGGAIHDPNPSLEDVVGQVRDALRVNWEAYSSVRFIGWQNCDTLTQAQRDAAIGLYINKDIGNSSAVGTAAKDADPRYNSKTKETYYSTNFKPWSNGPDCISYNPARAVMEYRFSCAREYAVHEFGHAIGFLHEWQHPYTPSSCSRTRDADEQPLRPGFDLYWDTYDPGYDYYIPNLYRDFDRDSIMTYEEECADVTGERFGSRNLDFWDQAGGTKVYPPVEPRPYDVGVIPNGRGSCPEPTEVKIYMDNEDTDNANQSSGWIGAIFRGRNTIFELCKIDGSRLGRLPTPSSGSAKYAVLKLGAACPPASTEFVRYHDDEDRPPLNISWMAGEPGPTRQNFDGGTGTEFHWCVFDQVPAGATPTMRYFPPLGFRYGVVAPPNFSRAESTGSVFTDDEDTNNQNRPQSGSGLVSTLMDIDRNTRYKLALVSLPPPPCERTRRPTC
jgi:hypothetical protein